MNENENENNNMLEHQKFYLIKENCVFKFIVGKSNNEIFIKCKNYETKLNRIDLSRLINKPIFNTIDEGYTFVINLFEENRVNIKYIIIKRSIKLVLTIYINNKERDKEISLKYNKYKNENNNELNINNNELKNDLNNLKEEMKLLKKEINELKILKNNYKSVNNNNEKKNIFTKSNIPNISNNLTETKIDNNFLNFSNPKMIQFNKYLTKDAYSGYVYDNSFSIFESINKVLFLIYGNENNSIVCQNLINNQKINEIKNAHNNIITNIRHYLDKINKRDLLLSICAKDNNMKIWNINNWECLLKLDNIYRKGKVSSASLLNNNNENYIITCNYTIFNNNSEPIKIFDIKGNQIKIMNDSYESSYFLDIYYDKQLLKNFIIIGNEGHIKSYDFNKNIIYHKYSDKDKDQGRCFSIIIKEEKNLIKIISSCEKGNIRIWNFNTGNLISKIKISGMLYGICLWNDDYLFAGSGDNKIKLIDLNNSKIIRELSGHNQVVSTIKKIIHPKYGECLISHGLDSIILWKN